MNAATLHWIANLINPADVQRSPWILAVGSAIAVHIHITGDDVLAESIDVRSGIEWYIRHFLSQDILRSISCFSSCLYVRSSIELVQDCVKLGIADT